MSDDKSSVDGRDRSQVSASDDYEVRYFADKHGISIAQAEQLIARHGNDRDALDAAARQMKG